VLLYSCFAAPTWLRRIASRFVNTIRRVPQNTHRPPETTPVINRDVVLDLHSITDPHTRADNNILSEVAVAANNVSRFITWLKCQIFDPETDLLATFVDHRRFDPRSIRVLPLRTGTMGRLRVERKRSQASSTLEDIAHRLRTIRARRSGG